MTYPVIFDTDHQSDWDDVQDVKFAAWLHREGIIDLLAVGGCTSATYLPAALEASLAYYGVTGVPIGTWKGATYDQGVDHYNPTLAADGGIATQASGYPDAVAVYRAALAAADDASVYFVATGPCLNLSALLASSADSISPLTGAQLVAAKVVQLVLVAGIWPSGAEYNFQQRAVAGSDVVANWPNQIVFPGIELASESSNVVCGTGSVLDSLPATEPLRRARDLYNVGQSKAAGTGRTAWGVMSWLWLTEGESAFNTYRGTASVNSSTGNNTWVASASGPHRYLAKKFSDASTASHIDSVLRLALTDGAVPSVAWSGYSWLNLT